MTRAGLRDELGTAPDSVLAAKYGLTRRQVELARTREGIPGFSPTAETKSTIFGILARGPTTSDDIHAQLGARGIDMRRDSLNHRLREMEREGRIVRVGVVIGPGNGRPRIEWDVVRKFPVRNLERAGHGAGATR